VPSLETADIGSPFRKEPPESVHEPPEGTLHVRGLFRMRALFASHVTPADAGTARAQVRPIAMTMGRETRRSVLVPPILQLPPGNLLPADRSRPRVRVSGRLVPYLATAVRLRHRFLWDI